MSGILKFKRLTYLYLEFINLIINFTIEILFFQKFYITILFTLKTHYSIFILLLYNLECYHYHQQFSIVALEENDGTEERKKNIKKHTRIILSLYIKIFGWLRKKKKKKISSTFIILILSMVVHILLL